MPEQIIEIGLNAVIVAIVNNTPAILQTIGVSDALPYGKFDPSKHRTMEEGLRELAEAQTGIRPGYVEQLYTFAAPERDPRDRVISIAYFAILKPYQSVDLVLQKVDKHHQDQILSQNPRCVF